MTTPNLEQHRAPVAFTVSRPAAVQDLLEPYLCDYSCFIEFVCDELRDPRSGPRVVEFGCGTGRLTVPVLAARDDVEYHGFEQSPSRVAIALEKVGRLGLARRAQFTAPFPLDARAIGEALQGRRADFVLLPRFLQTVPLCGSDAGGLHRIAFLAMCRQLVKPGGRILIIEDVYGENAEAQNGLARARGDSFRARLVADLERVQLRLRGLDPALAANLGRLPGDPALLGELQRRVVRADAQVLPLAAWVSMFEHLGFAYRVVEHQTQKGLHLFTVRC